MWIEPHWRPHRLFAKQRHYNDRVGFSVVSANICKIPRSHIPEYNIIHSYPAMKLNQKMPQFLQTGLYLQCFFWASFFLKEGNLPSGQHQSLLRKTPGGIKRGWVCWWCISEWRGWTHISVHHLTWILYIRTDLFDSWDVICSCNKRPKTRDRQNAWLT
jgi:hypothetical protein